MSRSEVKDSDLPRGEMVCHERNRRFNEAMVFLIFKLSSFVSWCNMVDKIIKLKEYL